MKSVAHEEHAIVLFDGVCNLCNGAVQFIVRRDAQGYFCFAALQSEAGQALLASYPHMQGQDSIVLIQDGRVRTASDAALGIARRLTFPWSLLHGLRIVPRPWRDALYRRIAANRYRWFGRRDSCMLPTEELRRRFLE